MVILILMEGGNVWVAKKDTKRSSILLLGLVSFFTTQTLFIQIYSIQDFFGELGMKLRIQLLEIILCSLYHVIIRPTKIIKDLCKSRTYIDIIYSLAWQRFLIILLGLTMTYFSKKVSSFCCIFCSLFSDFVIVYTVHFYKFINHIFF